MSFPNLLSIPKIDKIGVEERVNRFCKRRIKNSSKTHALHLALSMIDLTTLDGKDTPEKVKRLCYKANHLHDSLEGIPKVAAVCVYPTMVKYAKKELKGSKINVASVATSFPSGQSSLDVKLDETKFAVNEGADEIDMVISRGKFLAGEHSFVFDEIAAIKEACGTARLKVILETGELATLEYFDIQEESIGWITGAQVCYCAEVFPTVDSTHPDAPALTVLGAVLRNGYLHSAIREKGGAYGAGASQDSNNKVFKFFSYNNIFLISIVTPLLSHFLFGQDIFSFPI